MQSENFGMSIMPLSYSSHYRFVSALLTITKPLKSGYPVQGIINDTRS